MCYAKRGTKAKRRVKCGPKARRRAISKEGSKAKRRAIHKEGPKAKGRAIRKRA